MKSLFKVFTGFSLVFIACSSFALTPAEIDAGNKGAAAANQAVIQNLPLLDRYGNKTINEVPFDQKARYQVIFEKLQAFSQHGSSYLHFVGGKGDLASSTNLKWAMNDHARAVLPIRQCDISLNVQKLEEMKLSDDAIAMVIGHEMAHCDEPLAFNTYLTDPRQAWKKEYMADAVGALMAVNAGYHLVSGMNELADHLGVGGNASHPPTDSRVAFVLDGAPMETPRVIK